MSKYHFISYDGKLFKLTKKAYRTWIKDSANQHRAAKISRYGHELGGIARIHSVVDFDIEDFIKLNNALNNE